MSEYYFNKGFIQLTCDEDNLKTFPIWVKDRVGAELKVNSDLVMLCYKTITSTSNTLKNLYISKNYHSSYSTEKLNTQKEATSRLFSTYVTPQIKDIYRPVIIQEWKLNIDAAEYEKNMTKSHVPSHKEKIIVLMISDTGLSQLNQLFNGFLFMKLWNILEMSCKTILI